MKTKTYLLLILLAFFAITGCKKSDPVTNNVETPVTPTTPTTPTNPTTPTTPTVASGLYAVGFANLKPDPSYTQAAIWKNGVQSILSDTYSGALAIGIQGGDILTVGYEAINISAGNASRACYWRNSTFVQLSGASDFAAKARAIAIQGNDVYIAGEDAVTTTPLEAVYWKNGVKTILPSGSISATAYGITVVGSDVYVCGSYYSVADRTDYPCYWKNGNFTTLADKTAGSGVAYGIVALGNDIYISGTLKTDAVYWKNGSLVKLTSTFAVAGAVGISTNGSDIYIIGGGGDGKPNGISTNLYWKNGIENIISGFAGANIIAAYGNDLYIGGGTKNPTGAINDVSYYAGIIKNGSTVLTQTTPSYIMAIVVVP